MDELKRLRSKKLFLTELAEAVEEMKQIREGKKQAVMSKNFSMSFNVKTISVFERQAKRLLKKFPSFKNEIQILINELKEEPEKGTFIGNSFYKIHLSIASKGRGKSGGERVITHFVIRENTVYLLSV